MKLSQGWKSIAAGLALASAAHVAQAGAPEGSRSAEKIAADHARVEAILAQDNTLRNVAVVGGGAVGSIFVLGLAGLGLKRLYRTTTSNKREREIRKWIDEDSLMSPIFAEVERIVEEQFPGTKASLEHHIREDKKGLIRYYFPLNEKQACIVLTSEGNLFLSGFNYDTGDFHGDHKFFSGPISIGVLEATLKAIKHNTSLPKSPIQGHMGNPMTQANPDPAPIPTHIAPVVHTTTEEDPFLLPQKVWEDIGRFELGSTDVISEANIYIKYSRFEQAKTILKEGLDLEGDFTRKMHICWMLSCIYYKLGNVLEFNRYAEIVIDSSIHTPEMAERVRSVCNMGKKIDPEHPLYTTVPDWAKDEWEEDTMEMTGRIANARIAERNIDPHFQGGTPGEQPISITEKTPWSFPVDSSPWNQNGDGDLSLDIDFVPPDTRHQPAGMDEASRVGLDYGTLMRKIELAEEFLRIGDTEGAKDLVEEVIEKGGFSAPRGSLVSDSITIIRSMIPDEYKNSPQGTVGDMPEFSPPSSEVEEDLENMSDPELMRKLAECEGLGYYDRKRITIQIGTIMAKKGYDVGVIDRLGGGNIECINALIDMLSGKNSARESAQGGEGEGMPPSPSESFTDISGLTAQVDMQVNEIVDTVIGGSHDNTGVEGMDYSDQAFLGAVTNQKTLVIGRIEQEIEKRKAENIMWKTLLDELKTPDDLKLKIINNKVYRVSLNTDGSLTCYIEGVKQPTYRSKEAITQSLDRNLERDVAQYAAKIEMEERFYNTFQKAMNASIDEMVSFTRDGIHAEFITNKDTEGKIHVVIYGSSTENTGPKHITLDGWYGFLSHSELRDFIFI